jgi:hypothetical protein
MYHADRIERIDYPCTVLWTGLPGGRHVPMSGDNGREAFLLHSRLVNISRQTPMMWVCTVATVSLQLTLTTPD